MDEKLKTIVTILGLAGGLLALAEKGWKGVAWVVRHFTDRPWATAVHSYLAAPQDEAPPMPKPKHAEFFYVGGPDDPERRCIVPATRERAAEWGAKQGLFLKERDGDGRLVVRLRVDGPPPGETLRNTVRRVYDDLAEKQRDGSGRDK